MESVSLFPKVGFSQNGTWRISFIERDEYGSQVTVVPIAPDGSITRWPRHFFDEAEQALSSILRNKMTKG